MSIRPIQFGDEGQVATRELVRRFEGLASAHAPLAGSALQRHFRAIEALDRTYGGAGPLPLEDVPELAAAMLAGLARLEEEAREGGLRERHADVVELTVGVALWAVRHEVPLLAPEPVANALAIRSNLAASRQELAAVFGLMQGVIAHVAGGLAADLERSNPERPWRLLHVNLAITAIRTEDPVLMTYAFDALDAALPDERAAFYAEALALAMGPRIAPEVRSAIEARHRRWNPL